MKLETFFEKFELFADAPDAVAKMRELILELAVSGRLTTRRAQHQHDSDWCALALRDVGDYRAAAKIDPGSIPKTAWLLDLEEVEKGSGRILDFRTFGEKASMSTKAEFLAGDVLYGKLRPYLNKVLVAPKAGFCTTEIVPIRPRKNVVPEYLCLFLRSPRFVRYATSKSYGMKMPRLGTTDAESAEILLPPLAEQKRIVEKVGELMALCDRLEAQQQESKAQHAVLSRAALARFAEAPTPANLEFLFHNAYDISPAELRKSILTLAFQGKLVHQNPEDEPAEVMLRNIEVEKKRLCDRGELKADKKAWINSSPSPPHDIPDSWSWVRLQEVFEISRGGSPRPAGDPRFFGGSIPWITVGELTKDSGKYLTETAVGLTKEGSERSRFINPGDLLLTNSGATLGVPKISKIRGCINDGVAVLRLFHSFEINEFGYLYLTHQTPAFRNVNQGMGQPNLNTPIIAGWFFPLPPLAEQRRIVAKVDELMALVDKLETQLATARTTATNLLAAAVAELTRSEQHAAPVELGAA